MERILISGGAGFLGKYIVNKALKEGMDVTVIDDFSTSIDSKFLNSVNLVREKVENYYDDLKYDFVVHLAARPSPEDYISHPVETLMSNSLGTLRMLNIAKRSKAIFMYTSSSETYGNASIIPTMETYWGNVSFTGVRSCYDEGKRYSEALIMAFMRQYDLDTRIQRPFNVYGPGIRPDGLYGRVVPRFIMQSIKNEEITIHGDGTQTRSFLYVDDWVEATWKFLKMPNLKGEILNIGSDSEITIMDLANMIKMATNSSSKIVNLPPREDDPFRRAADISKARRTLNWSPSTELSDGLLSTIKWMRGSYL